MFADSVTAHTHGLDLLFSLSGWVVTKLVSKITANAGFTPLKMKRFRDYSTITFFQIYSRPKHDRGD